MANIITKTGVLKLQDELKKLLQDKEQVLVRLEEARQMGDLRENADYALARQELDYINRRVADIEEELKESKLEEGGKTASKGEIDLGSVVSIKEAEDENPIKLEIVSSVESDPINGKISINSPLGKALVGKRAGVKVEVKPDVKDAPIRNYQIISVH